MAAGAPCLIAAGGIGAAGWPCLAWPHMWLLAGACMLCDVCAFGCDLCTGVLGRITCRTSLFLTSESGCRLYLQIFYAYGMSLIDDLEEHARCACADARMDRMVQCTHRWCERCAVTSHDPCGTHESGFSAGRGTCIRSQRDVLSSAAQALRAGCIGAPSLSRAPTRDQPPADAAPLFEPTT